MLFLCAGDKLAQVAQQAKYAALAASRQALEAKRGQGRPQLRTEQRSAEKIGAASPLAARENRVNASAVDAAALLAENQRRLETRVCAPGRFTSPRLAFYLLGHVECSSACHAPSSVSPSIDFTMTLKIKGKLISILLAYL